MSTQQVEGIRRRKWPPHLPRALHEDVDPDSDEELTDQRFEQWRPLWQNPFSHPEFELASANDHSHSQTPVVDVAGDDEKALEKPEMSRASTDLSQHNPTSKSSSCEVKHFGPGWVHLFYDLAWTATFSALTQNGKFDDGWDNLSYVTFFVVMWWLWASQTLYTLHFYTNDWMHLFLIFLQLILFGVLAATTRGYDVTMYIQKSPGIETLAPQTLDEMTDPERYRQDRVVSHSLTTIAFSIAISRTLHWFQHATVWFHGLATAFRVKLSIPLKLYVLPVGLFVSMGFFWGAAVLTYSAKGKERHGAIIKFVLWGVGLLVEVVLHAVMEFLSWDATSLWSRRAKEPVTSHNVPPQPELLETPLDSPKPPATQQKQAWPEPHSNVSLRERLEAITTIILGEGLNGIAGTFAAILSTAGVTKQVGINVACAAIIIYSLAYFYFEGPSGHRDPKGRKPLARKTVWLILHSPFMLSIILLLVGVKNQFLFTGYLSTSYEATGEFTQLMAEKEWDWYNPNSTDNLPFKNFLLKRGLKWEDEVGMLNASITRGYTIPWDQAIANDTQLEDGIYVWMSRMNLKIMVNLYTSLMGGNQTIDPDVQARIQEYYTNYTLPYEDNATAHELAGSFNDTSILNQLLGGSVLGARFITGLAAIILISLAMMNIVHSKPRDRFQWGAIISRMAMGSALLLLELLNVGHYQTLWIMEGQEHRQAGVFMWLWAWWVLPTIAFAFALEFFIELVLVRFAGFATARKRGRISGPLWRALLPVPMKRSEWAK